MQMAVEAYLPAFLTVLTTAAIDSINPCAIGVLILMVSVVMSATRSVKRMVWLGSLYISAVMITYLLAGLGLLYFLASIPLWVTELISITIGLLIVFAGLLEIKDFFWYGRWFSLAIPGPFVSKIQQLSKKTTISGVILLGVFVSAVELPCTGAPYLAIITLLSQYFDLTAFLLLVFYNFVFVTPLIIILLLVAGGVKLQRINKWKQQNKPYMRLLVGLLLIALGWLLMLIANGTINLG
jgi:cytochrome c biogenesis protein CcdA